MKKYSLLILQGVLLLSSACAPAPSRELPPTLLWHKDQNLISPAGGTMNVWEGFQLDKDAFTAERNTSQFILWRQHDERVPIAIEYSLRGKKVEFSVNVRKKGMLAPTAAFQWTRLEIPLNCGMNFLQFSKKSKDKLRVRSIRIGARQAKPEAHLVAGQSFSVYHLPGSGRLELSGRGQVEIIEWRAGGDGVQKKAMQLKSGWLSEKISHAIDFSVHGLLTVKAKKGSFDISAYSYTPQAAGPADPQITFQGKPGIYIVLSDACQASHLGTYGYGRNTSPHIDAFAREAVVYENAYTNAVFTRASVATLFTGFYPDRHKILRQQSVMTDKQLTLHEYLQSKGYATSIFTSNVVNSPRGGFSQGVDSFFPVSAKYDAPKDITIFSQFSGWLEKTPPNHFSFLHYIHPHFPMVPPADFPVSFRPDGKKVTLGRMNSLTIKKKTGILPTAGELQEITDGYDASIAWVDSEFGKILSLLRKNKLYDDSMIIFLADHGEALGEHGIMGHGRNVYDETSRVPLIVKYPKRMNLQGRVVQLAELADIFPTIASLFGQPLGLDGRSLLANSFAKEMDDRIVVCRSGKHYATYGLRWRNWYYMINLIRNREQLFALASDPYHDISAGQPAIMAFLKARFLDWHARFRNGSEDPAQIPLKNLPASEIEELKSLGYL